jgi:thiol:disulfide interchange protein DsbA
MKENGADPAKFLETYKSFGVNTKSTRARQLTDAYKIDGVPAMGVQGRFYTSGALAGSHERMLQVVDALVQRSRT